jgi:hypothetical protein
MAIFARGSLNQDVQSAVLVAEGFNSGHAPCFFRERLRSVIFLTLYGFRRRLERMDCGPPCRPRGPNLISAKKIAKGS